MYLQSYLHIHLHPCHPNSVHTYLNYGNNFSGLVDSRMLYHNSFSTQQPSGDFKLQLLCTPGLNLNIRKQPEPSPYPDDPALSGTCSSLWLYSVPLSLLLLYPRTFLQPVWSPFWLWNKPSSLPDEGFFAWCSHSQSYSFFLVTSHSTFLVSTQVFSDAHCSSWWGHPCVSAAEGPSQRW